MRFWGIWFLDWKPDILFWGDLVYRWCFVFLLPSIMMISIHIPAPIFKASRELGASPTDASFWFSLDFASVLSCSLFLNKLIDDYDLDHWVRLLAISYLAISPLASSQCVGHVYRPKPRPFLDILRSGHDDVIWNPVFLFLLLMFLSFFVVVVFVLYLGVSFAPKTNAKRRIPINELFSFDNHWWMLYSYCTVLPKLRVIER